MKKRITPTAKKLAYALIDIRKLGEELEKSREANRIQREESKKTASIVETAVKLLAIATQGRIMPTTDIHFNGVATDFWGDRHRNTAREEPKGEEALVSLAIAANTMLSAYEGNANERRNQESKEQLAKVDINGEREKLIKLAMENPRDYVVETDHKSGMVTIITRGDGRRML
jgi:hypothetical protein